VGDPYRASSNERPRLWVPGVLFVDTSPSRLITGPYAGLWDEVDDLTNWKKIDTFVATDDLPEAERRLDALAAFPLLRALCESAPVRRVTGPDLTRARGRDVRLFTVGFARNADDYFSIFAERHGALLRSVTGAFLEIRRSTLNPDVAERDEVWEQLESHDDFELADRITRAVSEGLVDSTTLGLADLVERAVRGDHRLRRELERELEEIEVRARDHRRVAEEIAQALTSLSGDDDRVAIPVYGTARRVRHPALTVRTIGEGDLSSSIQGPASFLELPAEDEWLVDDVTPWEPPSRAVRRSRERRLRRRMIRSEKAFRVIAATVFIGLALLILAVMRR
jgi:hypothetical protein